MTEKQMNTLGWALFFLWLGIALFMKFKLSTSLIGIGVIILGLQIARRIYNLKVEVFWIVVGACLLVFNLFKIPEVDLPVIPILLIIFGAYFLVSVFKKSKKPAKRIPGDQQNKDA